jgi:sugar phosphate isomerase/epimerase
MQLGCCVSPEQLPILAAAGGEYAEFTVAGTVMGGDEAAFVRLLERVAESPVKPAAYNVLLPTDLVMVGPAVDRARLEGYIATAFARIARLTGPGAIVVFGSGRARSIPDGFPRDAALDQLADFLGWVGPQAAGQGITLAIEPLRRAESNVFNSLGEVAAFIAARTLTDVHLLADLYHMMEEGEPLSTIAAHGDLIVHSHTADSGRFAPGSGDYPQAEFFARLRAHTRCDRCSIECTWRDFEHELAPALTALESALGDPEGGELLW